MRRRKAEGFALLDVVFVCGMIGLLCMIALPSLLSAKQAATTSSAIGSMRTISSSQLTFALTCAGGFYAPNLTTLGTPPPGSNDAFITPSLGGADIITKAGYVIRVAAVPFAGSPTSCNGLAAGSAGQGFVAAADPNELTNHRFFATNATNQIYEDEATLFGSIPEEGDPPSGHLLR